MPKISLEIAKQNIPQNTPYCYSYKKPTELNDWGAPKTVHCPYWSLRKDKPSQMDGYCSYLELGDWEEKGTGLLWDQCKACGINWPEEL